MITLTTVCGLAPLVLIPGEGTELYRGLGGNRLVRPGWGGDCNVDIPSGTIHDCAFVVQGRRKEEELSRESV